MLKHTIDSELKNAMKAKDELRLSVMRMLSSAIHNRELDKRRMSGTPDETALTDDEVIGVIRSELKKRKDAIEAYEKGGRKDSARREQAEADILASFLPAELNDAALAAVVQEGIRTIGASSEKDFGKLMGWVMGRLKGQASGDRVSGMIKKHLSGS